MTLNDAPPGPVTKPELDEGPVTEPELELEPEQPKPEKVGVRVELSVETNEHLKSLAALWEQTKAQTAWKLLTGSVQHHYSINKIRGRL